MNLPLAFLVFTGLFAVARAAPACPCCAKDGGGATVRTCAAATAARRALSARSIYQIGGNWTDDNGQHAALTDLRGRPVVIAMFFTRCTYACPLTVAAMRQIREAMPIEIREKTTFVLVSFDSVGDGPAVLQDYRSKNNLDATGWKLLNGPEDDIRALAMVLGVEYAKTAAGQFSHTNLITVLDEEGRILLQLNPATAGLAASAVSAISH